MKAPARRLQSNAAANILQTVLGTGLLFALYRFINESLGVAQLGIWSVVLATVAVSHLADFGLTAGITRYVARDLGRDDASRAIKVVDTVMLTMALAVAVLAIPLYYLAGWLLPLFFDGEDLGLAQLILPYALVSLWLTMLSTAIQGALDGCQRMGMRALLVLTGQAFLLMLAIGLIPQYGLLGLAWAQLAQGALLVIAGRVVLRRALPGSPLFPHRWQAGVLKEMWAYGVNVQASTALMLLFDPVTKALMAKFGGAAAAGYFEMANQVVLKARALIVSANQAIVPYVASAHDPASPALSEAYGRNMKAIYSVAIPMFSMLVLWSPLVAWILLGTADTHFIALVSVLAFAWAVNVFNVPAYFFNMGTGLVGWNTICHLVMGVLNITIGYGLGFYLGAAGVIAAYIIAICTGSILLVAAFQARNHIRISVPSGRELMLMLCPLLTALAMFLILRQPPDISLATGLPIMAATLGILWLIWQNPNIQEFLRRNPGDSAKYDNEQN